MRRIACGLVVGLLFAATLPLIASTEPPVSPPAAGEDDGGTPVSAVRTYIDAARTGDYERAATMLDLRSQPDANGPKLARRLKSVLDRVLWIHYEQISDQPTGDLEDGLPPDLERLRGEGDVEFFLQRIPLDSGGQTWKFARSTVERVPSLYDSHGDGPLAEVLPPFMFEMQILEIELWQWGGLLILVLLAWVVAWLGVRIVAVFVRLLTSRTATDLDDQMAERLMAPVRLLTAAGLLVLGSNLFLRLKVPAQATVTSIAKALALLAIAWIALRIVDIAEIMVRRRLARQQRRSAIAALPMGRRVVKTFVIALAFIGVIQNLGFEITGLLAGLGVGGLAVALAAQKTIENLFGGVTILADQPIRVGDYCRFGDGRTGTVEEIGLRSTRIRTLDRTRVSVPNSSFSELHLENFAARDRIKLSTTLGLLYGTSPDQMRWVLAELRKVLVSHPQVTNDPARVRFAGFGASSLDIDVLTYVKTTDYAEFLAIREDIYLRFIDVVNQSGTGFAFPSQTLYLGRDDGLDGERTAAAEQTVAAWRDRSELPFPDLSESMVDALDGSAEYPPQGSASARRTGSSAGAESDD
ncbi:MAG: mechanosensitive ion channel family protein [Acidobacteriota bacterium]|nr:mechanosensitive ion channel family protein [Acidobacteriota bacterium]